MDGADASTRHTLGLVADVVVNVLILEHPSSLHGPLLLLQPALQAALAIAQLFPYSGVHLKYLLGGGKGGLATNPFPSKSRGISSLFLIPCPKTRGGRLVLGLGSAHKQLATFYKDRREWEKAC